jgi:signal transduction histidine kinase
LINCPPDNNSCVARRLAFLVDDGDSPAEHVVRVLQRARVGERHSRNTPDTIELEGTIAHGLRNPLSSIRTSAELAADGSPSEVTEIASDITSEVDRLERMVQQLLAYSQAPHASLDSVDVAQVLQDTVRNFARDIERRNVQQVVDVEQGLPAVKGDSALLEQLLNSLLANALEAMPHGVA